jgi:hypothetical protein
MKKTLKNISEPQKTKLGRRPISDELRKNRLLDVRFSAAEVAELKALAEKSRDNWADWVRRKLGILPKV